MKLESQNRIASYGIKIGRLKKGRLNKISDVPGITVGHATIDNENHKTGVTVVMPTPKNIFKHKLIASCHVINGYGKTAGLIQIDELGTLESPIALTNTLNVGLVYDGLVEYMIGRCSDDGIALKSLNPVVCECNDSFLNDIQDRAVNQGHVLEAIASANDDFLEGDIGGGKGMSCHQLKGGIGSASRCFDLDGKTYTVGVLVQSNHGLLKDLMIQGRPIGEEISEILEVDGKVDKGSIIIIIATDLPSTARQLKRICKRAVSGLARVGSYIGHGSGEIAIAFSTAQSVSATPNEVKTIKMVKEDLLEYSFRAVVEGVEEAVLNSMVCANTVVGYCKRERKSLSTFL